MLAALRTRPPPLCKEHNRTPFPFPTSLDMRASLDSRASLEAAKEILASLEGVNEMLRTSNS